MKRAAYLVLAVMLCAAGAANVAAAQKQPRSPAQSSTATSPKNSASKKTAPGLTELQPSNLSPSGSQKLAEASEQAAHRENASQQAENEDENAQFRQSASIQWMARLLHVSNNAAYWLAVVLNFAVIAVLIIWAVKKFLPDALRSRAAEIREQIQEAERASEDATTRLRQIEARLAQMGTEIAGLEAQARTQQQSEAERMKAAAEEERERILRGAQQEIEAMAAGARRDLRSFAAELAVSLAEKKIKVDAALDRVLVRDFAEQLQAGTTKPTNGGSANGGERKRG